MMCPVCKRDLAPTLSICLTCGAMINDTVREELESKTWRTADLTVSNSGRLVQANPPDVPELTSIDLEAEPIIETKSVGAPAPEPVMPPPAKSAMTTPPPSQPAMMTPQPQATPTAPPVQATKAPTPKPIGTKFNTADLRVKKTSPTLVEFQTKKATVPEWRLQLQNSVRQKVGTNRREDSAPTSSDVAPQKTRPTNGANALKVEFVEEAPAEEPKHQNPRVANALKRIEQSRRTFSNQPMPEQSVKVGKATPAQRNYPFNVVAKSNEAPPRAASQKATVNPSPKPMLVSPLKIEKRKFDTNKLPPLPSEVPTKSRNFIPAAEQPTARSEAAKGRVEEVAIEDESVELETETDEIDDLAPLSMRFSAGLFDMIIGVFASLILLSPFIVSGGSWISLSGFAAVTAAVAIIMFLYLTISLSFVGRTFGMRLFSLELVDVEENSYPTMHQAAVSSAVFLLSLAFAGVGFLPVFFNEERRAAHDILSGTILVREY